jgi:hypothetical protein
VHDTQVCAAAQSWPVLRLPAPDVPQPRLVGCAWVCSVILSTHVTVCSCLPNCVFLTACCLRCAALQLLDYERCEFLLVGASEDVHAELGHNEEQVRWDGCLVGVWGVVFVWWRALCSLLVTARPRCQPCGLPLAAPRHLQPSSLAPALPLMPQGWRACLRFDMPLSHRPPPPSLRSSPVPAAAGGCCAAQGRVCLWRRV